MAEDHPGPVGPDLAQGIAVAELADGGKLIGHVGDEPVLLARRGADVFAIGALCTHYSGPLVEGLIVDDTVRCPWHHACFDLRTGEALHAPAFSPVDSWVVEQRDGKIFVREKRALSGAAARAKSGAPNRIAIVGGGAAGFAAAEMLRRRKYRWRDRHAEQRRRPAGRPAEPFQGLSRRRRAGGLAPSPPGELLFRQRY